MLEEFLYEISVVYIVLFSVPPNGLIFFPPLRFEFCETETKALSQLLSPQSSRSSSAIVHLAVFFSQSLNRNLDFQGVKIKSQPFVRIAILKESEI